MKRFYLICVKCWSTQGLKYFLCSTNGILRYEGVSMYSLSGNVFQETQISYLPSGRSRKCIYVDYSSLHCLTNVTQIGKTALRHTWTHTHSHTLLLSAQNYSSKTKWEALSKVMVVPHSTGGEEVLRRQLVLYLWEAPCRVTGLLLQAGPTLASCTALPSAAGEWGMLNLGVFPPHLAQQEFHSCALRAPYAMNPSTVSEDKWRVLWKGISTTAIDPPKFYHSTRWGLLITLAGRNMTWKMWHSCYEPFYIRV